MQAISNLSDRLIAGAASLAIAGFMLAVAIAPANQGAVLPLVA